MNETNSTTITIPKEWIEQRTGETAKKREREEEQPFTTVSLENPQPTISQDVNNTVKNTVKRTIKRPGPPLKRARNGRFISSRFTPSPQQQDVLLESTPTIGTMQQETQRTNNYSPILATLFSTLALCAPILLREYFNRYPSHLSYGDSMVHSEHAKESKDEQSTHLNYSYSIFK